MYRRVLITPVIRTRLCITPNIASPPPFVLKANASHIIPEMAANESKESQESLDRCLTTLVSVIEETLRKHKENAIPNAQGAIPSHPNLIDLLLLKGHALDYLERYIQYYLRPADLNRDTSPSPPSAQPPPPPGYDPKDWLKWHPSPDPTEEPESPESIQDHSNSASAVAETTSGEEMDGYDSDDERTHSSEDERLALRQEPEIYAAEYQRKWEHFERQERRRLRRGISPPQLFRHPYIEQTMWTRNTTSPSEDAESDEDMEGDEDRGDEDRGDEETPWLKRRPRVIQ
jgi:hypothetical protein